jgi:hypothetical protein
MKRFITVFAFLFLSNAFAAEVSWMYVQNRKYESGRNLNRLGFGLIDENGCILEDAGRVSGVSLYAPGGTQIKLSPYRFDLDEEIFGFYDAVKSQFLYSDTWQKDSWFRADFSEPLIPGTYRLEVTTTDGRLAIRSFRFKQLVDLPVVASSSFKFYPDSIGNIIWEWDIPESLGYMVSNHQTEARASIDIIKDKKNIAYFFVKIPTHMGYVFIPRRIVQKINSKGDQYGLRIQLETKNKNSRTYSNTIVIDDMMATIP